MQVKLGVPYVKHKNPLVESCIYSLILHEKEESNFEIQIPDEGSTFTFQIPHSMEHSKKKILSDLLDKIGFNGLENRQEFGGETNITIKITVDEG